jgi:hypothetical protein
VALFGAQLAAAFGAHEFSSRFLLKNGGFGYLNAYFNDSWNSDFYFQSEEKNP